MAVLGPSYYTVPCIKNKKRILITGNPVFKFVLVNMYRVIYSTVPSALISRVQSIVYVLQVMGVKASESLSKEL